MHGMRSFGEGSIDEAFDLKGGVMKTFGDVTKILQPSETPVESDLWEETAAWVPEEEPLTPRIPDDVPEADLLEQNRLP
jgi:hypothetical protein